MLLGGIYGKGGDFLYRWGNPQAYRQGTDQDRKLFGQHKPYIIPEGLPNEGKIIVFNNGFGRTPLFSQIDILEPPVSQIGFYEYQEGTAFSPLNSFFTFPDSTPIEDSNFFSGVVSSAQQLPNGNILICEGDEGRFFEIDENNTIVWEYIIPISNVDGLPFPLNLPISTASFTFRATKYDPEYQAFNGRDLTPGNALK